MSTSAGSGDEDNAGDGRKGYGKRELSTSKRAAQNRAAQHLVALAIKNSAEVVSRMNRLRRQLGLSEDSMEAVDEPKRSILHGVNSSRAYIQRAFRQRKEGYIKKLEEQVRDYALLSENYKAVQAENYQLRDYIINLQSRLIESHGEFPQPPSNIDLSNPSRNSADGQRTGPVDMSAISQLKASAAQAVQDLGAGAPSKHCRPDEQPSYASASSFQKRSRNGDAIDTSTAAQEALQGTSRLHEPPTPTKIEMRPVAISTAGRR
ncbi:MAG: hypothetical protein Q9227_008260 [Pyrenula ochraceoflavens]